MQEFAGSSQAHGLPGQSYNRSAKRIFRRPDALRERIPPLLSAQKSRSTGYDRPRINTPWSRGSVPGAWAWLTPAHLPGETGRRGNAGQQEARAGLDLHYPYAVSHPGIGVLESRPESGLPPQRHIVALTGSKDTRTEVAVHRAGNVL